MNSITHLHLLLRSRTHGTLSPLPHIINTRCLLKHMNILRFLHSLNINNPVTNQKLMIGMCTAVPEQCKFSASFSCFFLCPVIMNILYSIRVKTNKCTNYSFNLLIIYSSSYIFQHYIAILREHSWSFLRDAQLRCS
jgi:hypothetical protein